ncbi:MAG: NINE protein [Betaproteobacteria bacterium]
MRTPVSKPTLLLVTLFFGAIGAHKAYLRKSGQGALYLLFVWTWIPALVALIELAIYALASPARLNDKYPAGASPWAPVKYVGGVAAIAGIFAAVAIPAHYERAYRSRVASAVSATRSVQDGVAEHFRQEKRMPGRVADLPAELKLGAEGVLTWTFPAEAGAIAGSTMVFRPRVEGSSLAWDCKGGTLEAKHRVHACR